MFVIPRTTSTLLDDKERLIEEVWLVTILALTELRELSTLDEELEIALELALIALRAKSTLLDEFDRLRLET